MADTTKILSCTCIHRIQDEICGKGRRVHNFAPSLYSGNEGWRCTVCVATKPLDTK